MAIVLRGMDEVETVALTEAMVASGDRVDLSDIPGPKVGKHSTGGVGDKLSIVVAPIVAACGVPVPKMSGRGLGHTGGTVDKLESIPGFRTSVSIDEFKQMVRDVGTAIIGQSPSLAPADKKIYALRDVTATVESVPLISASIMSKKLAEGSTALVLDVKCGDGAFMKSEPDARALARALVDIGSAGRASHRSAHHADGRAARGRRGQRARDRRVHRGVEGSRSRGHRGACDDDCDADGDDVGPLRRGVRRHEGPPGAGFSGAALDTLRAMIARQGGDAAVVDDYRRLPGAAHRLPVTASRSGYVTALALRAWAARRSPSAPGGSALAIRSTMAPAFSSR